MKHVTLALTLLALALPTVTFAAKPENGRPAAPLRLASYNIRSNFGTDSQDWNTRLSSLAAQFREYRFDIIGVQEPYERQIPELLRRLGRDYRHFVVPTRENAKGTLPHTNPIFFRKSRFELLRNGAFWYSETPFESGSMSWDASQERNCVWVQLRDKETGVTFFVFNSHFDHKSDEAKRQSAALLRALAPHIAGPHLSFFTGDFNSDQNSEAYQILTQPSRLVDSHAVAQKIVNDDYRTSHGYRVIEPAPGSSRIDHIFLSRVSPPQVLHWECIADNFKGKWASDHFPVYVDVDLSGVKPAAE